MTIDLRQRLGERITARVTERDGGWVITPGSEQELFAVQAALRDLPVEDRARVWISREHFTSLVSVDGRSGVVVAEAGIPMKRLEHELRMRDLSLGPTSPAAAALDLAGFLEGPWAGLRAAPGGRLEPVTLALSAVMPDGLRYVSRPSPRSAAGPDLDHLLLGGEQRFGVIVGATLRCYVRPRTERVAGWTFESSSAAVSALTAALAQGCWLRRAELSARGERTLLVTEVIGSAESVERDLASLGHEVFSRGGRSAAHGWVSDETAHGERELSWDEVRAHAASGRTVSMYRLGLESVIATGVEEGGVPLTPGGWSNAEAWALALGGLR